MARVGLPPAVSRGAPAASPLAISLYSNDLIAHSLRRPHPLATLGLAPSGIYPLAEGLAVIRSSRLSVHTRTIPILDESLPLGLKSKPFSRLPDLLSTLASPLDSNYLAYLQAQQVQPSYPAAPPATDLPTAQTPEESSDNNGRMRLAEETSKLALDDQMPGSDGVEDQATPPAEGASASKPKRVRTGCLTCRERHLKCDEGIPVCVNCRKSNRPCKRGVRLNFIDTKVEDPQIIAPGADWSINFHDESRHIASEYKGGVHKYAPLEADAMEGVRADEILPQESINMPQAPIMAHQQLPPIHSPLPETNASYGQAPMQDHGHDGIRHSHSSHSSHSSRPMYTPPSQHSEHSYNSPEQTMTQPQPTRDYLDSAEETLFMQVFVEEVGLWMDSMDPHKHFSRILPFYALNEPMLLNAFLACGARHLTLVNPAFQEDKALHYYDTATRALLKSLQDPNRDTIVCATAAVILNVYEVMSERALQRMNHIAGARALIKECGWNARSAGIGAACFWLNVGLEMFSCLHFNWQVAWNPRDWGVDMDMPRANYTGHEESWTHKIVYILARTVNYRASIPRFQEPNPMSQAMRVKQRCEEWDELKGLCETWNENSPRTMHPIAVLHRPNQQSTSNFPEVWLIKRTSVTARLFYHTAMCLLPQMHPQVPVETPDMYEMQMYHAHQICGIVAHVKDRGVAAAAIRCLAVAGEPLTDFKEQQEVLTIFEKIKKETGFRVDFIRNELMKKWNWTDEYVHQQEQRQQHNQQQAQHQQQQQQQQQQMQTMLHTPPMDFAGFPMPLHPPPHAPSHPLPPPPAPLMSQPPHPQAAHPPQTGPQPGQQQGQQPQPQPQPGMPKFPRGIVNPLMKTADFASPTHPYQSHYVPPSKANSGEGHYFYRLVESNFN